MGGGCLQKVVVYEGWTVITSYKLAIQKETKKQLLVERPYGR